MKTKIQKWAGFISVILCMAFVIVLSMTRSVSAQITPTTKGTVGVSGVETGVTVSAYKVIEVNVTADGQIGNPVYKWADEVVSWVRTNGSTYINTGNSNEVTEAFKNADNAGVFLEKMAAAIKNGTIRLPAAKEQQASGENTSLSEMDMGYYILTASGGEKIYKPSSAALVPVYDENEWNLEDISVSMKGERPGITKEIASPQDQTVAVGDTVGYQLNVVVPDYPEDAEAKSFIVGDSLSEGLTFGGVSTIKVWSVLNSQEIAQSGNYTVSESPNADGKTFKITFTDTFLENETYAGTTIYITYTATVNEKAINEDALNNTATLGYHHDPYDENSYDETPVDEEVFCYGISLKKVDKAGNALDGAQFTVAKAGSENTPLTFSGSGGVYTYKPGGNVTVLDVAGAGSQKGTLEIMGLDEGTYILKETKAPDSYILPNGSITVVIDDADPVDGVLASSDCTVTSSGTIKLRGSAAVNQNKVSFEVENTASSDAGLVLPVTGGAGTILFTLAGILLMSGAVAFAALMMRKKRG